MSVRHKALSLSIERRRIPPRTAQGALVLRKLPMPPSGALLLGDRGVPEHIRSFAYRDWARSAGEIARAQSPRRLRGAVAITLTFDESRSRIDIDTLATAPIKLLVALNLIESSNAHIVRRVVLQWGSVEGMLINVQPSEIKGVAHA